MTPTETMAESGTGSSHGILNVTIQGSGPYGFRLSGGDGEPMAIIKLRRQGKAHQAGLHEGDTVLGINGFSCRTMSHSAAMGILESAIQSIELTVFRGTSAELNSAYEEAASRLRQLPPGAAPPPRILPPPPSAETGSLVIDQPSFTRPANERFVITSAQNGHADGAGDTEGAGGKILWQPTRIVPPPQNGPRQAWTPSFDSSVAQEPPAATDDSQSGPGWSAGVWSNAPSQRPTSWTPHQPPPAPESDGSAGLNFRITSAPNTDPSKPWLWKPSVTYQVTSSLVQEPQQDWQPAPTQQRTPQYDERDHGGQQQQPAPRPHTDYDDGVPKWALPLRSDYDWKKSYPWLVDENVVIAEDDEWEYGYTSDGEMVKRRKKIFADSSFYDDPQHKYPTIEEQIKMARRVAQSLTAATNVSARGQRMFLRRREKADRWIVSELPPPNMAMLLRRGLIGNVGGGERHVPEVSADSEMEALYYNPAPWLRVGGPRNNEIVRETVKTPTSGARLPWKTDFDPSSSAAAVLRPPSPPPPPSFGQQPKWKPQGLEVGGGAGLKDGPAPKLGASGAAAFNVSKELRQMKGKGGKMFAKRRAQAAEEERRDELAETLRVRQFRKVAANEDWTDSAAAYVSTEVDNGGNGRTPDEPVAATPARLLELIERTRASSPGRYWSQSATVVDRKPAKDPSAYGNFSAEIKSRGNFRPVKFKAPLGGSSVPVTAATYSAADDLTPEGISDF